MPIHGYQMADGGGKGFGALRHSPSCFLKRSNFYGYNDRMVKGLYIHIPFCQTRCHYCNFVTTAEHSPALRERFLEAVFAEIKNVRDRHRGLLFDTLYLGGGTPSSLSILELKRLVERDG